MTACDAGNAVMMTIHVVICPCGTQKRPKSPIPTAFAKDKADSYRISGFGRFVLAVMLKAEGGLRIQQGGCKCDTQVHFGGRRQPAASD